MLRNYPAVKGVRLRSSNDLAFQVLQFFEVFPLSQRYERSRLRGGRIVGKNRLSCRGVNDALRKTQFMEGACRTNQKIYLIVFELFVSVDGVKRNRNKPVRRKLRV